MQTQQEQQKHNIALIILPRSPLPLPLRASSGRRRDSIKQVGGLRATRPQKWFLAVFLLSSYLLFPYSRRRLTKRRRCSNPSIVQLWRKPYLGTFAILFPVMPAHWKRRFLLYLSLSLLSLLPLSFIATTFSLFFLHTLWAELRSFATIEWYELPFAFVERIILRWGVFVESCCNAQLENEQLMKKSRNQKRPIMTEFWHGIGNLPCNPPPRCVFFRRIFSPLRIAC